MTEKSYISLEKTQYEINSRCIRRYLEGTLQTWKCSSVLQLAVRPRNSYKCSFHSFPIHVHNYFTGAVHIMLEGRLGQYGKKISNS